MIVDLETAKDHLRVTSNTEDALITRYMKAAEDYIKNYIDGDIPGSADSPAEPTPAAIEAAQLLIIGDLYENRQSQIVGNTTSAIHANPAVERLLFPYRKKLGI